MCEWGGGEGDAGIFVSTGVCVCVCVCVCVYACVCTQSPADVGRSPMLPKRFRMYSSTASCPVSGLEFGIMVWLGFWISVQQHCKLFSVGFGVYRKIVFTK